jgi:uncharacterized cupin superfamily protein
MDDPVYLMGGERREVEIADFPRLRKRLVRFGRKVEMFPWDAAEAFEVPVGTRGEGK